MRTSIILVALALAAAVAGAGCTRREHRRADHGVASRTFFDRQATAAATAESKLQGLDSEEAALVDQSYREALGTRGGRPRNDPRSSVLIVQEGGDAPAPRR